MGAVVVNGREARERREKTREIKKANCGRVSLDRELSL